MVSIAKYSKVLLIDCDLRKPVQHKIFKVSNKIGVSNLMKDVMTSILTMKDIFTNLKIKNLMENYMC